MQVHLLARAVEQGEERVGIAGRPVAEGRILLEQPVLVGEVRGVARSSEVPVCAFCVSG